MSDFNQNLQRLRSARLYAIIDTGYVEFDQIESITQKLIDGGVDIIQLRGKTLPQATLKDLGRKIRAIIPRTGPLFVLNDHPDLAPKIGADGVHVGQDDHSVATTRQLAGEGLLVGKSTHSLAQAIAASKEGADYIGVGPIYATATKPDYKPVGPGLIGQVRDSVRLPQFCIGGIKESTLPEVLASGGRRVVIVSALLQSTDIPAYCRRVHAQLDLRPLDSY